MTNTCAGRCDTARKAAQNWEEELASTLSDLKLTRGSACPCVVKGCIKCENVAATVHGDDITIGGEVSAVEFLIKNDIKKVRNREASDRERSRRREEWKNIEPRHRMEPRLHHNRGRPETRQGDT